MKHPKKKNKPHIKKIDVKPLAPIPDIRLYDDFYRRERLVVDLKLKDLSYREIQDHFAHFEIRPISKEEIAKIIIVAGKRAKQLNHFYDSLVCEKTTIAEADEIFQGRANCILGIVDKCSAYLFSLDFLKNRQIPTLTTPLRNFAEKAKNVEIILTDGLRSYPETIAAAFDEIIHLECNVHALRTIFRERDVYKRRSKAVFKSVKQQKQKLRVQNIKLTRKRKDLKNMNRRLVRLKQKRDKYYQEHGIKPYSKKIKWTPDLITFKIQINSLATSIRSKKKTIKNIKQKKQTLKEKIEEEMKKYREIHQDNLQAGRLVSGFRNLMKTPSETFDVEKRNYMELLERSPLDLAKKLVKYINDHPQIMILQEIGLDYLLSYNYRNTNTIERIFGIFRIFLNKLKHITQTPAGNALLQLLRFRYNFTPPKTGFHRHESPLNRMGIHSQYSCYLDALFPLNQNSLQSIESNLKNGTKSNLLECGLKVPTKI